MNKPESLFRTISRVAAVTALFATAACKQDTSSDRASEPFAPGAPATKEAGHREVVDVTGEVERLAKMVLEGQVTKWGMLTRNGQGGLLFVDSGLCDSPGPTGFVLSDGRAEPHPDNPMIPVPTHPAMYAMDAIIVRECPDNKSFSPVLDEEIVRNNTGTEEGVKYGKLRAIYVKLMARLGITVDPEPWNSQEAKARAKELGVDEESRAAWTAERAAEETTAKGK